MNRADRRRLAKQLGKPRPGIAFRGVILDGGPMADRIVAPDAPVLHPDWWRSWNKMADLGYRPRSRVIADPEFQRTEPGRYVIDPSAPVRTARWQPVEEPG